MWLVLNAWQVAQHVFPPVTWRQNCRVRRMSFPMYLFLHIIISSAILGWITICRGWDMFRPESACSGCDKRHKVTEVQRCIVQEAEGRTDNVRKLSRRFACCMMEVTAQSAGDFRHSFVEQARRLCDQQKIKPFHYGSLHPSGVKGRCRDVGACLTLNAIFAMR